MTDNEIVKALECCGSGNYGCENGCPLDKECDSPIRGGEKIMQNALDLINRLQAEKQNLEIELKAMRGAANSYKAENERLTDLCTEQNEEIIRLQKIRTNILNVMRENISQTKSEAYKELAERLKEDWQNNDFYWEEADVYKWIDNLLKELVGEQVE